MKKLPRLIRFAFGIAITGTLLVVIGLFAAYLKISPTLPDVEILSDVQLQVPLRVFSRDGRLMQVFGEKRRVPVTIDKIPACLKNAFIAGEDARFYEHPGIDYQGITRAVWHIVKTGGEKGPGGSTITQQLARHFGFVSHERTFTRKLKEWFLALKIERELSKDQILELFLNKAYLGTRAYGVAAAAHAYYGKQLDELTLAECAMIASLPKAPSRINPINNPPRALARRNYVLGRLLSLGYINQSEHDTAVAAEDFAFPHEPSVEVDARYASEMARARIVEMLGNDAYTGGYKVYTTFDANLQQTANQAVRSGLIAYDHRHGLRGTEQHFDLADSGTPEIWDELLERFAPMSGMLPALVLEASEDLALAYLNDGQTITLDLTSMNWARHFKDINTRGPAPAKVTDVLAAGDIIRVARGDEGDWQLTQLPMVEGALISLNPENGAILALVGGFDFNRSKFNRAVQAKRQPGSSFKPFIYSAALQKDYTPATLVNDAPVVFNDPNLERKWRPQNYSEKFFGPTPLRQAMIKSRNLVSIRMLRDIGVTYAWNFALKFGFEPGDIPRDLSMALGSGAVPPMSMARGYAALANGGFLIEPYFIERIEDGAGNVIYLSDPAFACKQCPERLVTLNLESQAAITSDQSLLANPAPPDPGALTPSALVPRRLAERIIEPETHFLVNSMMRDVVRIGTGKKAMVLKRDDLAGKTGTTTDQRDAWFSGFNHEVVTTTWVGFDRLEPLGKGEIGGKAALPIWIDFMREALKDSEQKALSPPAGVAFARIDPKTGKLCAENTESCILEVFRRDNMPGNDSGNPEDQGKREPDKKDPTNIF
jgi:penicillin-binding protein 1A